jgi:hypothetical protein
MHQPEKLRKPLQLIVYKVTLALYRVFAIITLYAVLGGILAYAFVMGFYAINSSWAAPLILSASDEKSLDFTQKLVISRQSIEDLKVDVIRQQTTLAEMNKYRASFLLLIASCRQPSPASAITINSRDRNCLSSANKNRLTIARHRSC